MPKHDIFAGILFDPSTDHCTPHAPERLTIEVTSRCSLGCIMCPRDRMKRPQDDIEWETFEAVASMARRFGPIEEFDLTGFGEPLERADLVLAMLEKIEDEGLANSVRVTTNGTKLTPTLSERLLRFRSLTLEVSLLAARSQPYMLVTGQNMLGRVETNLEHLLAKRRELRQRFPRVMIKTVNMDGLESEFAEFESRWAGKVDELVSEPYHRWGGAAPKLRTEVPEERYPCPHLFKTKVVSQDGRVSACDVDFDRKLTMGHVEDGLHDVWHGEPLERLRRLHLAGRWDEIPKCRSCDYWSRLADPRLTGKVALKAA